MTAILDMHLICIIASPWGVGGIHRESLPFPRDAANSVLMLERDTPDPRLEEN